MDNLTSGVSKPLGVPDFLHPDVRGDIPGQETRGTDEVKKAMPKEEADHALDGLRRRKLIWRVDDVQEIAGGPQLARDRQCWPNVLKIR
jgi:hypothetical protein